MAIYKDKYFWDVQAKTSLSFSREIYDSMKGMLTALGITHTEFGHDGQAFKAGSTSSSSWVPQWIRDVGNYSSPEGEVTSSSIYSRSGISSGSDNSISASSSKLVRGGVEFTIDGIKYGILLLAMQNNMQGSCNAHPTSDQAGGIAVIMNAQDQCDANVGGKYETKRGAFMASAVLDPVNTSGSSSSSNYGNLSAYDVVEAYIIKTDVSFNMCIRVHTPYSNACYYDFATVGHNKVTPFFDNTSIGDIYYLYPLRRVTKMHLIEPNIDISKIANLVTDRSIFNGQMHATLGNKVTKKNPLYNWYVGYDNWCMIGRIEGLYAVLKEYGTDYVLLDGVQHQSVSNRHYQGTYAYNIGTYSVFKV